MKFLIKNILIFSFLFIINFNNTNAFFNRELIDKKSKPFFINQKNSIWYVSINVGINVFGSENTLNKFEGTTFNTHISGSSNMSSFVYGGIALGYSNNNSNFVYELNFEYLSYSLSGSYDFQSQELIYSNVNIASFKTAAKKYKIGFNVYYNLFNPFKMKQNTVGLFFGLGGGLALQNNSINLVSEYDATNQIVDSSSYVGNVSGVFSSSYFYNTKLGLGFYYEAFLGANIDIGNYATARIKLKYTVFTQSFFNSSFKRIGGGSATQMFFNSQLISLEMSLLIKTN